MRESVVRGLSLPKAYHAALAELWESGSVVTDAHHYTRCIELAMTMVVLDPLREPMISKCVPCGAMDLEQYRLEMLDGIMDFCIKRGWGYTYHNRMTDYIGRSKKLNQVEFVIDELRNDPTSRRAVIDVRNNQEDKYSNDPACLQHLQFCIRDGALDCFVLFRSNDAVKACFMNAFALIQLQKRIADELGVPVGTYTHRANSFHAYERDWKLLRSYYERIDRKEDLTYRYIGDWDEMMEEARPDIMRKVEELRGRI